MQRSEKKMKGKTLGILVCTLLIFATVSSVAGALKKPQTTATEYKNFINKQGLLQEMNGGKGVTSESSSLTTVNAIVIIGTCSNDRDYWEARPDYIGRTWPQMPLWMTDNLIAPTQAQITNPAYQWSISNFFWWESRGQYIVIGDVNPGNNGEFFCSQVDITQVSESEYNNELYNQTVDALASMNRNLSDYDYIILVRPRWGNLASLVDPFTNITHNGSRVAFNPRCTESNLTVAANAGTTTITIERWDACKFSIGWQVWIMENHQNWEENWISGRNCTHDQLTMVNPLANSYPVGAKVLHGGNLHSLVEIIVHEYGHTLTPSLPDRYEAGLGRDEYPSDFINLTATAHAGSTQIEVANITPFQNLIEWYILIEDRNNPQIHEFKKIQSIDTANKIIIVTEPLQNTYVTPNGRVKRITRIRNYFTYSGPHGIYNGMEITQDEMDAVTYARPFTLYDNIRVGWSTPVEITATTTGLRVEDFHTSGDLYKIPVSSKEYFLLANHQKENHWQGDYRDTGLVIWHIHEDLQYSSPSTTSNFLEKWKREDVEIASGLYDLSGAWPAESTPCPEFGWDILDQFSEGWLGYVSVEFNRRYNGKSRGYTDLFPCFLKPPMIWKDSFTHLTNPSSNGYNREQEFYFEYPANGPGEDAIYYPDMYWLEEGELSVPENIATHIAIKNIRGDASGDILLDVFIDCVQSDDPGATSYNNGRRLVWDGDKLHMVYTSLGHVYYTYRESNKWKPAIPLDTRDYSVSPYRIEMNKYPAIAIDGSGGVHVCWVGEEGLCYRYNDTAGWHPALDGPPENLLPGGMIGCFLTGPAIAADNNNVYIAVGRGTVLPNPPIEIVYGSFPIGSSSPLDQTLDNWIRSVDSEGFPSLDITNGLVHVCWEKNGRIYYKYQPTPTTWSNIQRISDANSEPAHYPSLEIFQSTTYRDVHIVWQANGNIYFRRGTITQSGGQDVVTFSPIEEVSDSLSEPGEYPVVAAAHVVWQGQPGINDGIFLARYNPTTGGHDAPVILTPASATYPAVAIDLTSRNLHYVYTEEADVGYEIKYDSRQILGEVPNPPDISGPTSGRIGIPHEYAFVSTDPQGDNVYYYVEWGDGISTGWLGPYGSGTQIRLTHTWIISGNYQIRAKAKDVDGHESDWATLEVSMPKDKLVTDSLLFQSLRSGLYSPLIQRLLSLLIMT